MQSTKFFAIENSATRRLLIVNKTLSFPVDFPHLSENLYGNLFPNKCLCLENANKIKLYFAENYLYSEKFSKMTNNNLSPSVIPS